MLRRRGLRDASGALRPTVRDCADRPVDRAARRSPMTDARPADLVLTGGRIATMDAARSWASALAVRDGRIVAAGPDTAVTSYLGPSTRVIDLRGRTVTPGFQDAH